MTWQDYEVTVKTIYEKLGKASGVVVECYGACCKRKGASNVDHQIDVLISHSDGIHTYYTAIECKYWNEKVTKDIVMKVEGITNDCKFDKSVIVSKIGFTPDAITYAKFINVRLVELKENNLTITTNELIKFYMNFEVSKPVLHSANIIIPIKQKENLKPGFFNKNIYDYYLEKISKEKIMVRKLILDFLNTKVLKGVEVDMISETINFEKQTYIKYSKVRKSVPVEGLKLSGYKLKYTILDDDYFENKVWMIMKLLFEEKNYVLTFDGRIEIAKQKEPLRLTVGETNTFSIKPTVKNFSIAK